MILDITRDDAVKIACAFIWQQQHALDSHGGYPGDIHAVRDHLVVFINCNGEKYDGPQLYIMGRQEAIDWGKDWFSENIWEFIDDNWNHANSPLPDEITEAESARWLQSNEKAVMSILEGFAGSWGFKASEYADSLLSQSSPAGSYCPGFMGIA